MRKTAVFLWIALAVAASLGCASLKPTSLQDLSYDTREVGGMWFDGGHKTFAQDWVQRLSAWKKDGKFSGAWTHEPPLFTLTGLAGEFPSLEWRLNDGAPALVVAKPGWGDDADPWRTRLAAKGLLPARFDGTLHREDRPGAAPELLYELHDLDAYALVSEGKLLGIARIVALPRPPADAPFEPWKPPATFWYRRWSDMHEALKRSREDRGVAATHALAVAAGLSQVAPLLPGSHPFPEEMRRDAGWWLTELRTEGASALSALSAELVAAADAATGAGSPMARATWVRHLRSVVQRFAGIVPAEQQHVLEETRAALGPVLLQEAVLHEQAGRTASALTLLVAAHDLADEPDPAPVTLAQARTLEPGSSLLGRARRLAAHLVVRVLPAIASPPVDADRVVENGAWPSLGVALGVGSDFTNAVFASGGAVLVASVGNLEGQLASTVTTAWEEVPVAGIEVANPAYSPWKAGLDEVSRRLAEVEYRLAQVPVVPEGDAAGPEWTNARKDAVKAERTRLTQRLDATKLELERVRTQEPPQRVIQGGHTRRRVAVRQQRWSGRLARRVEIPVEGAPIVAWQWRDAPVRPLVQFDGEASAGLAGRDEWRSEAQVREAMVAELQAALAADLVPIVRADVSRRVEAHVARVGAGWSEAEREGERLALGHWLVRRGWE